MLISDWLYPFLEFKQNRKKQNKQNNGRLGHGVQADSDVLQAPIGEANVDGAG